MVCDTREKDSLWLQRNDVVLKAGLYLVATPIGNLRDITLRALDVLQAVDVVYCEDTRVSGKLMKAYMLKKPMISYNDHADDKKRGEIFARIEKGAAVALISDAGMPLISDPGYKLVRAAQERGVMVTSLPGANAPLSALQLSGMPSDCFTFVGFLPSKQKARCGVLEKWKMVDTTLIAFESAPRLLASLRDMLGVFGDRKIAVVREITKMFEEVRRGSLSELVAYYEENGKPKGEIVLVIEPPVQALFTEEDVRKKLQEALGSMRLKEAANFVAEATGYSRKVVYELALEVKGR